MKKIKNNPKLKKVTLTIKGMHCKNCVNSIESAISSLGGVKRIKVSLMENMAFVEFDPNKISLNKIKGEVNALGYSAGDGSTDYNTKSRNKTFLQGVAYGIIPHIGCIAFIIGSILGVTVLMQFFKPLLMNRYFFHILILISLLFATLSSAWYLKNNGFLSFKGARRKWKYLLTMYGSTIGINLILFMVLFPLLANVSASPGASGVTGNVLVGADNNGNKISTTLSTIKLKVDIPCPGHAPLISGELKTLSGVAGIQFSFPNVFDVQYDSTKTTKQDILSLEVFKTYQATVLDESSVQNSQQLGIQQVSPQTAGQGNIGGSCCGGGGCGGGCGCGGGR